MNVLMIYGHPDYVGGTEKAMQLEGRSLQEAGHTVYLLHGSRYKVQSAHCYVECLEFPELFERTFYANRNKASRDRIESVFETWKIDVVHLHQWITPYYLKVIVALRPVLSTIHVPMCPNGARYNWRPRTVCDRQIGLGCLTVGYRKLGCGRLANGRKWGLPGFIRGMARDASLRRLSRQTARVVVNSRWLRDRLRRDGLDDRLIAVVPPPIEDRPWKSAEEPELPPALVFTGRLFDFKGADHLLRASLLIDLPHRIWIIGDGPVREDLEKLAVDLGLTDRVKFFGILQGRELDLVRSRGAIMVTPSLSPETFALVGPEAMRLARPVVAYDVGGIGDWLDHDVTGKLVPAGDIGALASALTSLLSHPEQSRAMGEAGRQRAEIWAAHLHAEQLAAVYETAIADFQDQRSADRSWRAPWHCTRSRLVHSVTALHSAALTRYLAHTASVMECSALPAVIIAPHQDDETFGCGGLIALKRRQGIPVTIIFLTDGSGSALSPAAPNRSTLVRRRKLEALAAARILGVGETDVHFLDLPDTRLSHLDDPARQALTLRLLPLISDDSEIFLPHRRDIHPDHEATYRLVTAALAARPSAPIIYEYSIWMTWLAKTFRSLRRESLHGARKLDITSVLPEKLAAIEAHETQVHALPRRFIDRFHQPFEIFFHRS